MQLGWQRVAAEEPMFAAVANNLKPISGQAVAEEAEFTATANSYSNFVSLASQPLPANPSHLKRSARQRRISYHAVGDDFCFYLQP